MFGGISLAQFWVDFQELHDYSRRYPELLSLEEIGNLPQREWVRYCREHLWERCSQEKFERPFEELTAEEKGDADFEAIMQIAKAQREA